MKSGRDFLEFLKKMRSGWILVTLALLGVLFLLVSGYLESEVSEKPPDDELTALCLQIDGVGKCEMLINRGEDGKVTAVAVVCEGAERLSVREKLYKLISSFYGVGYNRISILKFSN